MATPTLPELERRLQRERSALAQAAGALQQRLRGELQELAPGRQLQRHAGGAVAAAGLFGLMAGHIAGWVLAALRR
ncbi:MAG TPA: hypothetical protein VMV31_01620 [Terriglobales bacterium]|nr:hypothetical protein [Terriglobales bacterium]